MKKHRSAGFRRFMFHFCLRIILLCSAARARWEQAVQALFPRQWHKTGSCLQCGACCDTPTIHVSSLFFRMPGRLRFLIAWHEFWYGFDLQEVSVDERLIVFTCNHLRADRTCDDYVYRPRMCRDYPRIRTWFAKPDFFPQCGFRPVRTRDRDVESSIAEFTARNAEILEKARQQKMDPKSHEP